VIASIAAFGEKICGTLADILDDETIPLNVRRQIPRILRLIRTQRSVSVLLHAIGHGDLSIRSAVLKALTGLRMSAPELDYSDDFVSTQVLNEARYYFELNAALAPFRDQKQPDADATGRKLSTAASLLARTLEEKLEQTLERLFRLLGLRYPPQEIHSAYLAVRRRRGEDFAAALEFLDSVLEREFKRVLLPLLDRPELALETGKHLFGVEVKDEQSAVGELILSNDPWLVACAMATAAELRLRTLAPDIARVAQRAGTEVTRVAESVATALA
jgi:AAA family ATP:ADP antiporter